MNSLARRGAYYLALASMELTLWVLAQRLWAAAKGHAAASLPAGMAVVLLSSLTVNLALARSGGQTQTQRRSALAAGLTGAWLFAAWSAHGDRALPAGMWHTLRDVAAAGFGDFRPALFALLLGLILWWRGAAIIRIPRTYGHVAFHFRLGVIVLLVLLVMRGSVPTVSPQPFIISFFISSLLALALVRAEEILSVPGGTPLTLGRAWLFWLTTATLATVTLGLLAAKAVSFASLRAVLTWMSPALEPVAQAIYELLLRFARLLDPLMRALVAFIQANMQGQPPVPIAPPALIEQGPTPAAVQWPHWLSFVLGLTRTVGIALVGLLILWILLNSLANSRQADEDTAGGQRQTVRNTGRPAGDNPISQLTNRLLNSARNAMRRRRHPQSPAEQVKWLYANLLRLGAARGTPRPAGVTPYGYQITLRHALNGFDNEIGVMTEAYVQAHYGEETIDTAILEQVRTAWDKIRAIE